MDLDDFYSSLLGDASSLANTATIAGTAGIASDITGYNLTPGILAKNGLGGVAAAPNQQLLLLMLMGFAIYMIVKHG